MRGEAYGQRSTHGLIVKRPLASLEHWFHPALSRGEACMTFFPLTGNTYLAGVCVIVPMAQIWVPESCRFYHPGPDCASAPLMGH